MRRFLTLVCFLCLAIPAGVSFSGCTRNPGENYCNGLGYGAGVNDLYSITLKPTSGSLSMAYGQTKQSNAPTGYTCKGDTVSVTSYSYGTTDSSIVDVSPTGGLCAGTWNRNTGGGVSDYTICTANDPTTTYGSSSKKLPYGYAYITASAKGVTSNSVLVYVHAPVTSLSLAQTTGACYSQGETYGPLQVSAYYTDSTGTSQQLCSATAGTYPACSDSIGTLTYSMGTSTVATIDSTTNMVTAAMPGTTLINATVADSTSTAGSFSTCPPKSIKLTLPDGTTSGSLTKGVSETLTTTVTDTKGNTISGLSLDYQSTEIEDITASSAGAVSAIYPGSASIYAVCQPSSCNPAPTGYTGIYGTGLPVSSNKVSITIPGTASQYVWYAAPGSSRYFNSVEMLTGEVGSPIKMTYVPNSMAMDKGGDSLYFGSSNGMMIYSATSNAYVSTVSSTPGVVLAVSPDNSYVVINDQSKEIFYVYSVSAGSVTSTYGGLGASAVFSPDDKTLYISDSKALGGDHADKLYVYNSSTGWSTYSGSTDIAAATGYSSSSTCSSTSTAKCSRSMAMTIPSAGVFISGTSTISHTHCPSGTIGDNTDFLYYPLADTVPVATDILATAIDTAETDTASSPAKHSHILGALLNTDGTASLSDTYITIPNTTPGSTCPGVYDTSTSAYEDTYPALGGALTALTTSPSVLTSGTSVSITATDLNQIVVSPSSSYAFLTYSGSTTGAKLPYYQPASSAVGSLSYLSLTDSTTPTITAPVAAAFSPDNKILFVSTSGDNKVHYIYFDTTHCTSGVPCDYKQITPALPACTSDDNGCTNTGSGYVPATIITVKPRATT